jgi:heptosyltransferase-1
MLVTSSSRANKSWPAAHWVALVAHLNAQGHGCVLVHGDDKELAQCHKLMAQCEPGAHVRVLPRMGLAELMDHMASSAGVIGVDSGLSHLAVALDLPHVQIYNFDTAWRTGPQDRARQLSVWARPTPSIDQVVQAWQRVSTTTNG